MINIFKTFMIKKQTKIVATVSDLNCSPSFIRSLHDAGVDVIRLNTAFQSPREADVVVANIRSVSDRLAILLDTKGPEIRTLAAVEKIFLSAGERIKIKGGHGDQQSSRQLLLVNYPHFAKETPRGARIMIDDGEMELLVKSKGRDYVLAEAVNEGEIKPSKSVNVPSVHLSLPSLSEKDKNFIAWAIKQDIDFIAHSFVRNQEDVLAIQRLLDKAGSRIKIIAKIENRQGVDHIEEILDCAHGVMVARGDLGVEIPAEDVPLIQKNLIARCIARQKPIITATQMLQSMVNNPRPTRAEVSDVANAVLDGTDALMLSGETAFGKYPLAAVKMMSKIAQTIEGNRPAIALPSLQASDKITDYLAKAAVLATRDLPIKEIIISSASDYSAERIAAYRSLVPVFLKSFDKRQVREMALTYGVHAHYFDKKQFNEQLIYKVLRDLVKKKKIGKKDLIVYLSGDVKQSKIDNALEICEVNRYI